MEQLKFIEFLKSNNENFLLVEYNRKRFIGEVSRHSKILELVEESKLKVDLDTMEKGTILNKTEDKYRDRDFL